MITCIRLAARLVVRSVTDGSRLASSRRQLFTDDRLSAVEVLRVCEAGHFLGPPLARGASGVHSGREMSLHAGQLALTRSPMVSRQKEFEPPLGVTLNSVNNDNNETVPLTCADCAASDCSERVDQAPKRVDESAKADLNARTCDAPMSGRYTRREFFTLPSQSRVAWLRSCSRVHIGRRRGCGRTTATWPYGRLGPARKSPGDRQATSVERELALPSSGSDRARSN